MNTEDDFDTFLLKMCVTRRVSHSIKAAALLSESRNRWQCYKGELTENALLDKAAKLAATKHQLLADPKKPAPLVNAHTKSLSRELAKLTKRLRQFPSTGVGAAGPAEAGEDDEGEEEGSLVTEPLEQWLKQMIKGSPSTPKPQTPKPSASKVQKPSPRIGKSSAASLIPRPTTSKLRVVQKPATRKYRERLDELRNTLEELNKKREERTEKFETVTRLGRF